MDKYFDLENSFSKRIFDYDNNYNIYKVSKKYPLPNNIQGCRDSSFFDVTILKNGDKSMDTEIIAGIQNRRTDPLVFVRDIDPAFLNPPIPNPPVDEGFKFYTTAELQNNMQNGGNIYLLPNSTYYEQLWRNSAYWKDLYWKRLGARELKLKLHHPLHNDSEFESGLQFLYPPCVRIREIIDENHKELYSEPFNHKIDTVIDFTSYGTKYLNAKLQPGQGKLVRLEYFNRIISPIKDIELNQLPCTLAFPEYISTGLQFRGTSCDSLISTRPLLAKQLFVADTSEIEHIDWTVIPDYTKPPTDTTLHPCTEEDMQLMTRTPAKFVTRWETRNGETKKVLYLIWNGICYCDNAEDGIIYQSQGYVNQNYTDSTACDSTNIPNFTHTIEFPDSNYVLGGYSTLGFPSKDPTYIGSTTINASANRNYIAWSDAHRGIGIGYQLPGDTLLRGVTYIPYVRMPNNEIFTTLMYPELNRYSRVSYGEDEAALVFVGKKLATLDDSTNQIFYTRIKVDSLGNIVKFLPQIPCSQSSSPMQYDSSGTMAMVSYNALGSRHKNPQIIRNVAEYQMPNVLDNQPGNLAYKMDRIVWESKNQENRGIVQFAGFDFQDNLVGINWTPYCYFTTMPTQISSMEGNVVHPSIAQGIMRDQTVIDRGDTITLKTYYNDSAMVMAFGANDSLLFHVHNNFWTLMSAGNFNLQDLPNINQLSAKGTDPVLPTLQTVKDDSLYKYMKIFYLDDSSYTQQSSQYFYKRQNFSKQYHQFFGIANKDKKARWFTPLALTDEQGRLNTPKVYTHKVEGNRLVPRDTIITDWFEVSNAKTVDYLEKGDLTSDYSMKVQRQRDGKIFTLQNANKDDKKYTIRTKMLLNGKNENYRILWTINKENARFAEQIVIGDISERAELDGMLEERELGKLGDVQAEEFIDLNEETYANTANKLGLSVYPNPANDELYVICYLPRTQIAELKSELNLKLYDNLGKEVYSKQIKAGQIVRILTNNFRNGNYFVKVFQQDQTTIPAEVRNVIIER